MISSQLCMRLSVAATLGLGACVLEKVPIDCLEVRSQTCYESCVSNPTLSYCRELCDSYPDPICEAIVYPDAGVDGGADAGDANVEPCDGGCGGETPVCDETADMCVQCLVSGDCGDALPVCNESTNTCVQCTEDGTDACTGETPYCNDSTNTCVGCLLDTDCSEADAAKCNEDQTCAPCDDSAQCAGVTEGEVALAICTEGTCFECTEADTSACGGNPCTTSGRCSAYGDDQDTCDPCDTDANCGEANHFCVPMMYMGGAFPDENDDDAADHGYCLLRVMGGNCVEPYSVSAEGRITLNGVSGNNYCGLNEALTTCELVRALMDNATCAGGMDSECPQPGGLCRTVGAISNRCTYPCSGVSDCKPSGAGSTCDDGGTAGVDYCGG